MRKAQKKLAIYCIGLMIFALSFFSALAQNDPPYTSLLSGDSIKVGKTITVHDTVFFNPILKPTILRTNSVSNIISLRINEYSNLVLPDSFKLDVKIRLIYISKDNLQDSVRERTLSIDYNKLKSYKNRDIYYLKGGYQMQVKVLQVTASYAPLNKILPVIELENKLQIDRDYVMNAVTGSQMNCSANAIRKVDTSSKYLKEYGELKISWLPNRTVEMYDVEWTYIDKSALDKGRYNINGQLSPKLIFKNNATRVTTTADTCMIPLLYDGKGSLFFRVRGVQEDPGGELITTLWSSEFISEGGLGRYNIVEDSLGHEWKLNWQASTTFAEEAKRKSVVQYFDGSLRNRQTVTRDNTTHTTVVAETFYDKQGRPAIQVLPVPTLSKLIGYTPWLNVVNINGSEYDKGIYDTLMNASDYCDMGADSMSVASGTSRYYSPNNPLKEESFHQFIPDAKGYGFTETRYSQDNTGRINKQGGVGKDFKIGSSHETKYYYGTPEQTDLDALFGTEAGDASHYQKNMVRDANGQYSVSYVDMHGRTIATALAGDSVRGMQRLNSYRHSIQTEQLLNLTNNVINGNSIQSSKSMLVSRAGDHTFTYSLGSESLTLQDCQQRGICYDCLYDLTITITDDCNNQLLGGNPVIIRKSNFKLFEIDTTCNLAIPIDTSFSRWLEPGSYNITKELSISKEGMQYYRDSLYLKHNTCKTYDDILKEQKEIVRNDINCDNTPETQYEYQSYRRDIMMDLYPLIGQYADTAKSGQCYSIFNKIGEGGAYQGSGLAYKDEEGNPTLVMNDAGVMVTPQQLTKGEFILNFQKTWADALLPLHPEYALLLKYESFAASHQWEEDFSKTETYAEAKTKGYLNPTGNTTQQPASGFPVVRPDPLYSAYSESNTAKQAIENKLFNFQNIANVNVSLWGFATAMSECPDTNSIDQACVLQWNQAGMPFNEASLCEGEWDMAWKIFRTQYLTKKQEWLINYIRSVTGNPQINAPCLRNFTNAAELLRQGGLNQTPQDSVTIKAQADQFYADNCKAYATRWWEQLKNGCYDYKPEDSSIVISYLVEVCKQGADIDHPYGSSTVKPGSTYRFKSFEEVIKFYNDSTGRATNIDCNSYLINKPLPYNQSVLLVRKPLYGKPDECECEKINDYYNQFSSKITQYGTFSNFMLQKYNTNITQGALDSLRNLCNNAISCKYIPKPIYLSTVFQCVVDEACVPCSRVKELYDSFLVKFPNQSPAKEEPDTVQQKINRVFVSYMNQQLGFSKSHLEYLVFLDTCSNYNEPPVNTVNTDTLKVASSGIARPSTISCDKLITTYKNFLADFPDPAKGAVVKVLAEQSSEFAALSSFSMAAEPVSFDQVMDSIPALPDSIQQSPESMAAYEAANNTEVSFQAMALAAAVPGTWVDSLLQCKPLFEWYFNNHLNTSGYTYENFTDWLVNSCGYKIKQLPCSDSVFVSCDTLQQVKNLFEQRYPASLGNTITETIHIPVHKVSHIVRRFQFNGTLRDEFSFTSGASLAAMTWTNGGLWQNTRDNIGFDFRALPANATINDAALNLFAKPEHLEFFPSQGAHYRRTSDTNITGIIERLTGWVIPGKTLWSTQPATLTANGITLAPLSVRNGAGSSLDFYSNEDYLNQHCTQLARDLHAEAWQNRNYGVQFRQNLENIGVYKAYTFWGITPYTPIAKLPNLDVNYTASRCDVFTAFVNTQLGTHLTSAQVQQMFTERCGQVTIPCQDNSSSCDVSFQKIYKPHFETEDTTGYLSAQDIIATPDGGFVVAGSYTRSDIGEPNGILIKTDTKGNVLWSKTYTSNEFRSLNKVEGIKDGGYIALGYSSLLKTDEIGNIQWTRSLPDSSFYITTASVLPLSNGGYSTVSGALDLDANKALHLNFTYVSDNGAILKASTVKLANGSTVNFFHPEIRNLNLAQNGDSIIVSGSFYTGYYFLNAGRNISEEKSFLIKYSLQTGAVSMLDEFSATQQSVHFSGVEKLPTGDYILTAEKGIEGAINPQITIARLNPEGKIVEVNSTQFMGTYNADAYPTVRVLDIDNNGNYYTAYNDLDNSGIKLSRNGGNSPYASRLNNTPLTGSYYPGLKAGVISGNDGLALVGDNSAGSIVVVRVNKNGNTGCDSASFQDVYHPDSFIENTRSVLSLPLSTTSLNVVTSVKSVNIISENSCSTEVCPPGNTNNGPLLCGKTEAANEPFEYVQEDPCADSTNFAIITATERDRIYKDSLAGAFEEAYQQKCLNAINLENFTVSHPVSEYHYTLYYYDQAGNLIKTVPPEGVHPNRDQQWLLQVAQKRKTGERLAPDHTLPTVYRYNSLNQVVTQKSPDGGYSEFWYDRLGRLAISRNAKQKVDGKYSYTLYDPLGRIIEVGQKQQSTLMTNTISRSESALKAWLKVSYFNAQGSRCVAEQVTSTIYDFPDNAIQLPMPIPVNQKSYTLRNRVSYTRTYEYLFALGIGNGIPRYGVYDYSTTYSYDIHGNVDTLMQQYRTGLMAAHGDNRFKVMAYKYDLISGKVNQVHYQPGQPDQLYHRYEYDAENRITDVYISDNKLLIGDVNLEEHDAHYDYYKHGPMSRTVLGHQQVQGLDYAYTLQGWMKGVNSTGLDIEQDMGNDGKAGGVHKIVAKDAYGFNLNYFTGEYSGINTIKNPFPGHTGFMPAGENRELFNGNISSMAVNIGILSPTGGARGGPQLYNYQYDQLNRLVAMDAYRGYNTTSNNWNAVTITPDYKEQISYDANGNILSYFRNGSSTPPTGGAGEGPLGMDNLQYGYNKDVNGNISNNKLRHVKDDISLTGNYTEDIDNQSDDNYTYDAIGNLIKDNAEKITNIQWSVYGKILSITKTATVNGDVKTISYTYDAAGNRISKRVEKQGQPDKYTWYVRDASGNVMAVYDYEGNNLGNNTLYLSEHHLYGSSRLGVWNRNVNMDVAPGNGTVVNLLGPTFGGTFERGKKFFELSNHLQNVLVTISDKKIGVDNNSDGNVDYYNADVITANDYYPFGSQMPGRKYTASSSSYRYGFNGKENDKEVKEDGNFQDYGFRMYDVRLGRFISVDPLKKIYPELTPYQFASNRPIDGVDMDGLEYVTRRHIVNSKGVIISTSDVLYYQMSNKQITANGGTPKTSINSAPYGPEGKGIKHEYYLENGQKLDREGWDSRQNTTKREITFHGLYSGPGSITKHGVNKENYDFSFKPIDAADAIAKTHDINYAKAAPAENYQGFIEDTRTLAADNQMVEEVKAFLSANSPLRLKPTNAPTPAMETTLSAQSQLIMISALSRYKTWKIERMKSLGLDKNNPDHMQDSRVTLENYKVSWFKALTSPRAAAQRATYQLLKASK